MVINKDIIEKLKTSIPLFSDFTDEELLSFLKLMKSENFENGEAIFQEYDEGDQMYILIKGLVKISKAIRKKEGNRQDTILATLQPGECFGEMVLIDRRVRSASATSEGSSFLFSISHDTLNKIAANPKYAGLSIKLFRNFSKMLAKRLREQNDKYVDLSFKISRQETDSWYTSVYG